jgi:SAM-dependent methyltransferase
VPYPADLYAAIHDGTPGDVEFYRRQCDGASSVLELGCGHGRILSELAQAGRDVVGLELDAGQLALARDTLAGRGVQLIEGDMRTFDLGRRFDRILIPHTGLYCLLSEHDVVACLQAVARHLHPDGRLVLDAYHADDFHRDSIPEDLDPRTLVPLAQIEARGVRWQVLERSSWDRGAQRITATYVHVPAEGETIEGSIEQRYLLTEQLAPLLERAGLRLLSRGRSFDDAPGSEPSDVWWAVAALA